MDYSKESIKLHKKYKGKICIKTKVKLKDKNDFSLAYTPGVGAVCKEIVKNKNNSWLLTNRANTIAVISDGSAVLGFGNLGPEAAMPVMEGKAAIFKEFGDVDAIPICINTQDTEEIIKFCKNIEPSLGGINLEDISAPRCFEILKRLENELSIPVFHDDQDGTAIVVLAALINACQAANKNIKKIKVVVNGAGAAGMATVNLLLYFGIKNILLLDSQGIICNSRTDLNKYKKEIASKTNIKNLSGQLEQALFRADVFIGVSKANLLDERMIKNMNSDPTIFAMANPIPEIMPNLALKAGALIVGTGRSDFSNQINNALVFPGIFRGLLDSRKKKVTMNIKKQAAIALASIIKKPSINNILPNITDKKVVKIIANSVMKTK
jgi:malate dehydrogenase (oxaloacetate-decarboxylating)